MSHDSFFYSLAFVCIGVPAGIIGDDEPVNLLYLGLLGVGLLGALSTQFAPQEMARHVRHGHRAAVGPGACAVDPESARGLVGTPWSPRGVWHQRVLRRALCRRGLALSTSGAGATDRVAAHRLSDGLKLRGQGRPSRTW